jgi:hypothetical protein
MCSDNEEFRDPDVVRSEIFVVYFFVLCNLLIGALDLR